MNAISGITVEHLALLDQYQAALRLWSESRALYAEGTPEVAETTKHLENLEALLRGCNNN